MPVAGAVVSLAVVVPPATVAVREPVQEFVSSVQVTDPAEHAEPQALDSSDQVPSQQR